MPKKKFFMRYFVILAVFIFAMFMYGGALLNYQVARHEEFQRKTKAATYTRTFVIPAVRGEIFDRHGTALVTNELIYDIVIDGVKMPKKDHVGIIIDLVEKISLYGGEAKPDGLPVNTIEREDGEIRYSYSMVLSTSEQERRWLDRFFTRSDNKLNTNISADEFVTYLTAKYKLDEYMPPDERDHEAFRKILGICYDFDRLNVLVGDNEYTISKDISMALMSAILENSHNYPGVEIRRNYKRVYHFPATMPHVIGRIGDIPKENKDYYLERGYSLDAIVGISGVELAFEEYLRGVDGLRERTYDQDGNLLSERYIKEPVEGKNVYLTIDIKLQQVAENALASTIDRIHKEAAKPVNNGNGKDAFAGAAAVTDPTTGQVLALATYPSYDMTVFGDSEKYNELNADNIGRPFRNRATSEWYAPGSVFKIATSIAALCNGNITPSQRIQTLGKYTRYDYQPQCWAYKGGSACHGSINVSQAIEHSCNYFFFHVADNMGIAPIAEYARQLGLGERTGIEIWDTPGVLASPASKDPWLAGDTLQAAIGQSENLFSPLQMANMVATVVNGGNRYKCTLLLCVKEYGSDKRYYEPEPFIYNTLEISDANLNAVRLGMRNSIDTGSGRALFNRIPTSQMRVGGKTGTAQVSNQNPNATFVAFAPYDDPQLTVSVVIEKGAHGSWAGFAAEDIIEYYFGYTTFEESMGLPQ
jgi:penicillin-binding protein 2